MVGLLTQVDKTLAAKVAEGLGIEVPDGPELPMNQSVPADADPATYESVVKAPPIKKSDALSMANTRKDSIKSRQIAFLVADGVDAGSVKAMRQALEAEGAMVKIVAPKLGMVAAKGNAKELKADQSLLTSASVLFDAIFVPDGEDSIASLGSNLNAMRFLKEAFRHCKALAGEGQGALLVQTAIEKVIGDSPSSKQQADDGVVLNNFPESFIKAIAQHRFWERETALGI
jgi:catalase